MHSIEGSKTQSLSPSLACSLPHWFARSLTHSLAPSLTGLLARSRTHSLARVHLCLPSLLIGTLACSHALMYSLTDSLKQEGNETGIQAGVSA